MKEADIQRSILQYLAAKGHYPVRINTQGVPVWGQGKELLRWRKSPMVGVPDILGISRNGVFFAIECKRKGNKATAEQLAFLNEIKHRSGIAIVAYSLDDVINTGL